MYFFLWDVVGSRLKIQDRELFRGPTSCRKHGKMCNPEFLLYHRPATMLHVQKPKLITVLEPLLYHNDIEECVGAIEWMRVTLDTDWVNSALACEGRYGFIHEVHGSKASTNRKEVYILESVGSSYIITKTTLWKLRTSSQLLVLKQLEVIFEVSYAPWDLHKRRMLQENAWCSYAAICDCFYSRPNLGLDLGYIHALSAGVLLNHS